YDKAENLEKTRRITRMLHDKGIATEAEPGRINGGEDGVKDTGDLEGLLTTAEEALEFVGTGIDFLAPAFGNVHGNYGGVENIKLDFESKYVAENTGKVPLTELMGTGTDLIQELIEYQMDIMGSTGKA
ncbi:putative fructose-bisphosphate aldolase, partial [Lachnellula cervina]